MSNRALNRMLQSGGLREFHVGNAPSARRGEAYPIFRGERFHATFSASEYKKEHDFAKKENREEGGKRKKMDDDSGSGSDSDDDEKGRSHFSGGSGPSGGDTSGKNGFPAKGSDGDGDGKKNEKRKAGKKGKGPWQDKDGDGIPNKVDKK